MTRWRPAASRTRRARPVPAAAPAAPPGPGEILVDGIPDQPTRTLPLDEGAAAFGQFVHGRTGGSKIVLLVTGFAAR